MTEVEGETTLGVDCKLYRYVISDCWFVLHRMSSSLEELASTGQMHGAVHEDNIYVRRNEHNKLVNVRLGPREPQRRQHYPANEPALPPADIYALGKMMEMVMSTSGTY